MILGAVAKELFPQIDHEEVNLLRSLKSLFGTTLGFLAGLYFIYALDYVIASIEKNSASNKYEGTTTLRESSHLLDYQTFQFEDREFKEREINSDGSEHQVDGIV